MRDLTTLSIKPRPSRMLLISSGGAHVLSSIAVIVCSLPLGIKTVLVAGIALALARFGWQYAYPKGKGFTSRIELLDERWQLETGDGVIHLANLRGGYAHIRIVILNFRLENGRQQSLTLLPDSADPDSLRRLRVWLRTQRQESKSDRPW